ncbi:MAG: response regulator [Rickettsiaceae bacterium]|nr:response regulator [Rickettsiaceae bacterium]MDP4832791.1 response regulator [Rickettsiaceae bacterium]MDP5020909.1 response regulator [Rickettsiaceae bacterium]MDP5082739.1 response regulator [Rickettsiaceae bacterium]
MKKVLIVEDNDLNLKLFYDLLMIKECDIIVSKDGVGVIDIATTELPRLILMDIQLNSGISGIDLIRELKANETTKHIPIIAITAFAMKSDEDLISQSGCDMYLSKPVSIERFFQAIDFFINPTSRIEQ